jgi:hypothetical protein
VVLAEKAEDIRQGAFRLTKIDPQLARGFGGAGEQLAENVEKCGASCGEDVPRPLEAAGLDDFGRRIRSFNGKTGPLIEISLKPADLWRAIRQVPGGENRKGEATGDAQVALNRRLNRTLGVAVATIDPMAVGTGIAALRTNRTGTVKGIFSKLDGEKTPGTPKQANPKSTELPVSVPHLNPHSTCNGSFTQFRRVTQFRSVE